MTNKSHHESKIKAQTPSLDEFMERLAKVSGETRVAGILRWMDVSPSSYANWRRRGTVPYNTIVSALLKRGLSLDWFFSPYKRLDIPRLTDAAVNEEMQSYARAHPQQPDSETIVKAYNQCQNLLNRYQMTGEPFMRIMLDMYFNLKGKEALRSEVLEHLARSLAALQNQAADMQTEINEVNECSAPQPDDK